ncbi:unnamed protein product [Plutella xylostella]|uniref:(diamondback moth) hypothetical protein n=1 Tax=Plutella xylostella TaxID=51655 RepID=A0A8S4D355_PLUXY|nr:unnamed protein product [Plutella xylostella]
MCRFEFILLVMSVVWVAGAWGAHYPTSLNSIGGKTAQQENRNWLKSETQDTLKEDESESLGNHYQCTKNQIPPNNQQLYKSHYLNDHINSNLDDSKCPIRGLELLELTNTRILSKDRRNHPPIAYPRFALRKQIPTV